MRDAIIKQAVKRAQERARREGLTVGQVVAHPDEPAACELLAVDGEVATVRAPNGRHAFPVGELFDPNVAMEEALKIQAANVYAGTVAAARFN